MKWQDTADRLSRIAKSRELTAAEAKMLARAVAEIAAARPVRTTRGKSWPAERVAYFCEMIADGMSPTEAGAALGITRSCAQGRWRRIKLELGWQAA